MKKKLSGIAIIFLLSFYGLKADAQTETFDFATFVPPKGWDRIDSNGIILFQHSKPVNDATTFCQIFLYPGIKSSGNAQKDFSSAWNNLVVKTTSTRNKPKTETTKSADGWTVVTGYANISVGGITFTSMLVTASGFTKSINVLVNVAGQDYMTDVQDFLNTYELDSKKALATTPPRVNSGLPADTMTSTVQNPGSANGTFYYGIQAASGGFNYGNSKRYLYLGSNNTFRYGYYQEGYYNYSTHLDQQRTPDFAGTYTRNGDKISLNFYSGRKMELALSPNKRDLDAQLYKLIQLPALHGVTIEGTYVKADLIRELWPNGRQPKATLHNNGRFEDEGLLGLGENIDVSLPYQEWKQRTAEIGMHGSGSYSIIDNSLLLNYDDGRKKQLLIYLHEEEAKKTSPASIVVAGLSFTLIK